MRILVSGSTGFIGSALTEALAARGDNVVRLVRRAPSGPGEVLWNPQPGRPGEAPVESGALEGLDAVVHLGGDPIAAGRWTAAKKARIRASRVDGAAGLARTLAGLNRKPRVFVCASAVGIYGDRGEETLIESSPPGTGFLAETGRAWEAACHPAAQAGIRVAHARFGMVLHPFGGALSKLLPIFRLGAGGPLGSGRQWMSWIAREDAVGALLHILATEALRGPVNCVAPEPVRNAEFTRALGSALRRPAFFPVPAFGLRLLFGEMANEALLASARVLPERLRETAYRFRFPRLEPFLRQALQGVSPLRTEHRISGSSGG